MLTRITGIRSRIPVTCKVPTMTPKFWPIQFFLEEFQFDGYLYFKNPKVKPEPNKCMTYAKNDLLVMDSSELQTRRAQRAVQALTDRPETFIMNLNAHRFTLPKPNRIKHFRNKSHINVNAVQIFVDTVKLIRISSGTKQRRDEKSATVSRIH